MTKPVKKPRIRASGGALVAKTAVEAVLDASIETLELGLTAIREEIEAIKDGRSKSDKHDKGSRIAFLTARVGAIADSIRKVEAARSKRIERMTKADVISFARTLDPTELAGLVREMARIGE